MRAPHLAWPPDRRWMGGSPPTAPVGWMWTMVRSSHTTVFPTSSRLGLSALAGHRRRTRHTCARAPCLVLALRRPCAPSQRHQVARTAMAVDHGTARARPMTRRPRGLTRVARSTHNHTHTHTNTRTSHGGRSSRGDPCTIVRLCPSCAFLCSYARRAIERSHAHAHVWRDRPPPHWLSANISGFHRIKSR